MPNTFEFLDGSQDTGRMPAMTKGLTNLSMAYLNNRLLTFLLATLGICGWLRGGDLMPPQPAPPPVEGDSTVLIPWLLGSDQADAFVAFRRVVEAATGQQVLPFDAANPRDLEMLALVREALDRIFAEIRDPGHPVHKIGRINEVSRHFEERLAQLLDEQPGYTCGSPPTRSGNLQGSGYPDLRFAHEAEGRVFYLDPKVHQADSESSSFRTFYFEPKGPTNKINDNATHLIVGLAHEGRQKGRWVFTDWKLIDLYDFEVRLKAEFQASNREIYREEATIATRRQP